MKLTILGEYGPWPPAGGACSGYLLSRGDTHVLLDCGSGVLARLQQVVPLTALSAVVLSHLHSDHMADLGVLRYAWSQLLAREAVSGPLPIYCPAGPEAEVAFLQGQPAYDVHVLSPEDCLSLGGMDFSFTAMRHPVPTLGISAQEGTRRFFFTGDTNEMDGLAELITGADILLCNAGLLERDWTPASPHLSVARAAGLAAGCRGTVVLTHLSPFYTRQQIEEEALPLCPHARLARAMDTYA